MSSFCNLPISKNSTILKNTKIEQNEHNHYPFLHLIVSKNKLRKCIFISSISSHKAANGIKKRKFKTMVQRYPKSCPQFEFTGNLHFSFLLKTFIISYIIISVAEFKSMSW